MCSAPRNVKATFLSPSSMVITWDPPKDGHEMNIYEVFYTTKPHFPTQNWQSKIIVGRPQLTITALETNSAYTIRVREFNFSGNGRLSVPIQVKNQVGKSEDGYSDEDSDNEKYEDAIDGTSSEESNDKEQENKANAVNIEKRNNGMKIKSRESGNEDVNYKQPEDIGNRILPSEEDSSNEKKSCSKSVKRKKLEEKIHGRETDSCRPRGDGDLGGDLRNAFLSVEDSDINLRVGDQNYPAHKVIIRNRSSVFRAMLEHDMSEKNKGIIDIEDCDPHIFKDFLLYLYSGKIDNISKENVFELYYMSDKYDVKLLKLDCVDYIINNFSTDVICDIIILAVKHNEQDMLKHATEFFIENAEDIFITVQWQKFMKENSTYANELILKAFRDRVKK